MRVNKPWKPWKWLPVFFAMPRMLRELGQKPEMGLLGVEQYLGNPRRPLIVQYWRSYEALEAYARNRDATHWPAWVSFNKKVASTGDVGIWHETYMVKAGGYETVYNNMPPLGLGKIGELVSASGKRESAKGRIEHHGEESAGEG